MHYLSICVLLITIIIVINAHVPSPPWRSLANDYRSCPEEYRELLRRNDETNSESDDDDDENIDGSETREDVCEQAMGMIIQHRNFAKLDPSILLTYCPHYDERLEMAKQNNNTLCETKKQEINMMRKRQQLKRKRNDDFSDSYDDDDDTKRRALRRRELKKRVALRFIRKRMS